MSPSSLRPTLYPHPPVDSACAPIEHPLLVTRVLSEDSDVFTNTYALWKPPPGLAVFGGILIGEAIHAAQQTVATDFVIYNMKCTFHAPPDATKPLYYRVSRTSDARSMVSREVKGDQGGTVFFSAECNFSSTRHFNLSIHQTKFPQLENQNMEVPPTPEISRSNEKTFTEQMVLPGFLRFKGPNTVREDVDPFIWRDYPPVEDTSTTSSTKVLHSWTRTRGNMSDSRVGHLAVLGCLTDSWALSSLPEINPKAIGANGEKVAFMISLNHTIWFHDPQIRLDDWLLVRKGSSWAAEGRCLIEQQIWNKNGKLVATCIQEGALRFKQSKPGNPRSNDSKI